MIQIDWQPDKQEALTKQIVDFFREKINSGQWVVGTRLPSQRKLAEMFKVNRSTIVNAVDILKSDGLIEGQGRAGMVVIASSVPLIAMSQTKWQHYIEEGIHLPNYKTIKKINDLDPDPNMLRFSSGELSPDLYPKEEMKKILSDISLETDQLGYEWPTGMACLRQAVCDHLKKKDIHVTPGNVLIVSGALQGFQLITMGLLQTGSTVLVEKPSYLYSLQILQTLGMRKVGIAMDDQGIIVDDIPYHMPRHHASILYTIPNYQNPTGMIMSLKRRQDLLKMCYKTKLPIIEDDVYGDLWIDQAPAQSLKSMDKVGNVLYVGSVSKSLSPGLRIGWVVGPESVINRLADIKMQMDYGSSSISQLIVAKCLSTGMYDSYMTRVRKELKKRRDFMLSLLDKHFKGMAKWKKPSGGFYIWLTLSQDISMYKVFDKALKSNILINPGYIYESSLKHTLRLSYSYSTYEEIEYGIKKLAQIIKLC